MPFGPDSDAQIRVEFQGKEYLLIGDLESGGAIATRAQYENFTMSYAHLHSNGDICRFDKTIGHRDDLKVLSSAIDADFSEVAPDAKRLLP